MFDIEGLSLIEFMAKKLVTNWRRYYTPKEVPDNDAVYCNCTYTSVFSGCAVVHLRWLVILNTQGAFSIIRRQMSHDRTSARVPSKLLHRINPRQIAAYTEVSAVAAVHLRWLERLPPRPLAAPVPRRLSLFRYGAAYV
ncbi:uncharacterized protein V6R79_025069 [Siganus canaliculatus]